LDKETGLLRLDRVLSSAVYYPADYGFIPRTYCDDGDPLDALVLGQEPVYPLTIVEARAVAVMRMRDEKGTDDKTQIQRFFEDYKVLEHKHVVIEGFLGSEDAVRIIREAMEMYRGSLQP
jgi:inorganic pyrophosphatase